MLDANFPPAGYIPANSSVPGIDLFMPAPQLEKQEAIVEFRCPQCNGETAYNAADGGLNCAYCGFHEPPPKEVVGKGAEAFEFTVTTVEWAAHGWGIVRDELQCQNCGALTAVPPGDLTHTCPFCASNQVVHRQAPQDLLRPRFLIPLKISEEECRTAVREWLGSSWMTPGKLRHLARTAHYAPIYIPYWTFDAFSTSVWRAQVAHTRRYRHYNLSTKKWETRTKTEWKWESGNVRLHIDDLLVSGTNKLSRLLLERIQRYNLHELVLYDPSFLAGVQAQAYDVQLDHAWAEARRQMRARTKSACQAQATSQRMRNFSMNLDFSQESWRYILMPLYVATYRYEDKTYQVMINGQTGVVGGQRPVDWRKIGLLAGLALLPGVFTGLLSLILLIFNEGGFPLLAITAFLLALGAAVAFYLVHHAQQLDDI
jgi:Zn finger protein HypA/HybF involved in hydrogenase expression